MEYFIKKVSYTSKDKSYYDNTFHSLKPALKTMADWVEFDITVLQAKHENNTIYFAKPLNHLQIAITRVRFDSSETFQKLKKLLAEAKNLSDRSSVQEKIQELIEEGKQRLVRVYMVFAKDWTLPKNRKSKYLLLAYFGETMLTDCIFNVKENVKSRDIENELFFFTSEVATRLKTDSKDELMIEKDKAGLPKYTISQNDKILCTTIVYDVSSKEILI